MKNSFLNQGLSSWETENTDTCESGRSRLFFVAGNSSAVSVQCVSQVLRKGGAVNTGVYLGRSYKATWIANAVVIGLAELL